MNAFTASSRSSPFSFMNATSRCSIAGVDDVPPEQAERVLRTNVVGYALMAREAEPHIRAGASIISTVSSEKLEKVVKPPMNPTPSNSRQRS